MSCLFQSLSHFVPSDSPGLIRQKICNYLALNKPVAHVDATTAILWESTAPLDEYVRKMRREITWGGAIEIQAFCELYGISVRCIDLRMDPRTQQVHTFTYVPRNRRFQRRITIEWHGTNHYEPATVTVRGIGCKRQ